MHEKNSTTSLVDMHRGILSAEAGWTGMKTKMHLYNEIWDTILYRPQSQKVGNLLLQCKSEAKQKVFKCISVSQQNKRLCGVFALMNIPRTVTAAGQVDDDDDEGILLLVADGVVNVAHIVTSMNRHHVLRKPNSNIKTTQKPTCTTSAFHAGLLQEKTSLKTKIVENCLQVVGYSAIGCRGHCSHIQKMAQGVRPQTSDLLRTQWNR